MTPARLARRAVTGGLSAVILAVCCMMLAVYPVRAAEPRGAVRVTSGDHPDFGRVVLDAHGLDHSVSRDGEHLLIRFPTEPTFGDLPRPPRNVLALRTVPGGLELTLPPDAVVHITPMGTRIVIDVDNIALTQSHVPPAPARDTPKPTTTAANGEPAARTISGPPSDATKAPSAEPIQRRDKDPRQDQARAAPAPLKEMPEVRTPAILTRPADPPVNPAATAPPSTPPAPNPVASAPTADPRTADRTVGEAASGPASQDKPPELEPIQPGVGQTAGQPEAVQADAAQVWPVTRDPSPVGPVAIAAFKASPPGGLKGSAIQVPFPNQVGAALFSRGSETFVVFDERRPIDLAALHDDPAFGSAVTSIFPAGTLIRLTRPPGQSAMLSQAPAGWRLSLVPASPRPAALTPVVSNDGLTFAADAPGQVVAITDPQTGGTLLVGTQRASGQGVAVERRTPEFLLPVTGQGIVVVPLSDAINLRITQAGFVLSGGQTGLVLSPPQPMEEVTLAAASLTRRFEFPRQSTATLAWRAKMQAVAAAMAPPLTRGPLRHTLAESLLGLGLGVDAQILLKIAMKDDPREASSPSTIGLAAIAALLAGRPREAGDLADPRLTGTDEVALWRAIQTAMTDEGSPKAAAVLATTAPLLFTYPAELRRRVLPLALETMILGGAADAAAPLLAQREKDPSLAYARALLLQAKGDNDAALAAFDALANSRSTFDHARAAIHAVELRLTMGKLDNKTAADALEALLYAWRGDQRDLALRLRIAELRTKTGEWRSVFTQLRGAKVDFPGQAMEIDRRLKEAFAAVPRDPGLDKMPPTDLIALLDENAELMADGPDGEPMRALLAEKLMALDLPKRADPLLTKLMRAAPYGPARAGFGATLATLRLHEDDGDGALLALSESNSADMPDAVRERRALITARVEAKRGHVSAAVEALSDIHSQEADETRANILEQAQDWPAARDALVVLAAHVVPESGVLTDAQLGIMLRLATAATRAGDEATLTSLREKLRTRVAVGPRADLFRLLTAAPVRGTADLGRARAEMGLARAITADLTPKKPAEKSP